MLVNNEKVYTRKVFKNASKNTAMKLRTLLIGGALTLFGSTIFAADGGNDMEKPKDIKKLMKADMALMKPDLQKQVQSLSLGSKRELMKIMSKHTRRSDTLTLRQVMHEVLSDYQSIASGIMTDNAAQAADSARRLANHRLPKGGLLPYMKAEHVSDAQLSVLVPFNDSVEGNALRLAAAADKGNIADAAQYLGKIAAGCVGCHQVFRGQPGTSSRLR